MPDPTGGGALPGAGELVVAAGAGVTGLPVVGYLAGIGAQVVVTSNRPAPDGLADIAGDVRFAGDLSVVPAGTALVVTSAGIPPRHPLLASAVAAGIEVIGETELAWRIDHAGTGAAGIGAPRDWLVVTGTNGKTTTIGMLQAMLREGGRQVTACGNVGWPVLDAVLADRPAGTVEAGDSAAAVAGRQDLIAAELSSFQLYYAPSIRPRAAVVLNLAEDHLDWHGSMAGYAAAKAIALTGDIAVAVIDPAVPTGDRQHPTVPTAAGLLAASPASVKVGVIDGPPAEGQIGIATVPAGGDAVIDRAFGNGELFLAADLRLAGRHNLTNAMAAAALALAAGVAPGAIRAAIRAFGPSEHRNQRIAEIGGVDYVNDSKATNPHAAAASLLAYPRVVWLAGGQLKGAGVDELVLRIADRLAGVVLLGVDAPVIEAALARHAPDVPRISVGRTDDGAMDEAVRAAATLAAPGTAVVLAPAAASLDMFGSYAARGEAFARAVAALDRP